MIKHFYLFDFFVITFCFLTMFVPDSYQFIRFGVLLILLFLTFFNKNIYNLQVDPFGVFILLAILVYNLFCCTLGAVRNAPGAYRVLTAEFLWPILFTFIGIKIAKKYTIIEICKLLLHIEFILVLWDLWYCLGELKIITFPSILKKIDLSYMFGKFGFFIQFSTTHMVTHIFMIPFTMIYYILSERKVFCLLLIPMQLLLVSISGRAVLILITFTFFCNFLLKFLLKKSSFWVIILKTIICVAVVLGIIYLASNEFGEGVVRYISEKIRNTASDTGHVDSTRYFQHKYLLDGWQNHILFGNGSGSYDPRVIRDKEHPWFYELAYHAFLYQKGLFWLFLFIVQLLYIFIGLKQLNDKNHIYNCFAYGLFAILVANVVDPYLNKFGCLWMLYLPFVIVICNAKPFCLHPKPLKWRLQ